MFKTIYLFCVVARKISDETVVYFDGYFI